MEQSRAERARRLNLEITNYLEHGDARGREWLDKHPEAAAQAAARLQAGQPDPDDRRRA